MATRELCKKERELLDNSWNNYIETANIEYDEYNLVEATAQLKRLESAYQDYQKLMDDMGIITTLQGYRKRYKQ